MRTLNTLVFLLFLTIPARAETNKLSSLWVIEGKSNKVYLQASIHLLKPEHYPLSPAIDAAFSNSTVIVFEADIGEMNSPKTAAFIAEMGLLDAKETLETVLPGETYRAVESMLSDMGVGVEPFKKFKPWFLSIMLSTLKLQVLGYNPKYGVDYHFHQRAKEAGKTLIGLETMREQISMLDSLSPGVQDAMLAQTIKEYSEVDAMFEALVKAWQSGDTRPLEGWVMETYEAFPDLYKNLIAKRNRAWLSELEKYLASGDDHMVIVGAAHLVGNEGLLILLRTKGYSIQQR